MSKRVVNISVVTFLRSLSLVVTCLLSVTAYADRELRDLFLKVDGISEEYQCSIPETTQGSTIASCHDYILIDMKNNSVVGTLVDAASDYQFKGDAITLTSTLFMKLPRGDVVVRGESTVQRTVTQSPVLRSSPVTHFAGLFPKSGENNILSGTGIYKNVTGNFHMFAAVDFTTVDLGYNRATALLFVDFLTR